MTRLTWHPSKSNPLDFVSHRVNTDLVTPAGDKVKITQSRSDFLVTIGNKQENTGGNLSTCYYLNHYEVGIPS